MAIFDAQASNGDSELLPAVATSSAIQGRWTERIARLPTPRPSRLFSLPRHVLIALLPRVCQQDTLQYQITESSWMDGLRGIASFAVFNHHFLCAFTSMSKVGFGFDKAHMQPLSLPIIRLVMDGPTAVCVFFGISGYVVSARALKLSAKGQKAEVLQAVSTSLFRRGFRLYLPMLCIMTMTSLAAYFGLFEYTRQMMENPTGLHPRGRNTEPNLKRYDHLLSQLGFLFREFWANTNIVNDEPFYSMHDPHLWTMSTEYRGSLLVYGAIIGLCGCRPYVRLVALFLLALVQLILNRWEGPLFFVGAAIAQLDVMRRSHTAPADNGPRTSTPSDLEKHSSKAMRSGPWMRILRFFMFALALFLMSYPIDNIRKPAPGYTWINSIIPSWCMRKARYPRSMGTLMLIYLLSTIHEQQTSLWMKMLNCRPAQYMGQIMFAFYLVHGPVLHMVGYAFPRMLWARIGYQKYWEYLMGLSGGWLLSLMLCLWVAEVFDREVVVRCTRLTKWLEGVCFVSQI